MKKFKYLMFVAIFAISNTAFGQFMNTSSAGSSRGFDSWKAFVFEYNSLDFEDDGATGITVGINKAKNFNSNTALYFEYGFNLQYAFEKADEYKFNMLTAKVPLNLYYALEIDDNNVIAPFIGLPLNVHLLGKMTYEDYYGDSYDIDPFNSDDMDGDEWTRFQIGWNVGVRAFLGEKFIATVSYGATINDLADYGGQIKAFTVGVGFRF